MTTKATQFFSRLDELLIVLTGIVSHLKLYVILYRGGPEPAVQQCTSELTSSVVNDFRASRIYLAEAAPDFRSIDPNNLHPGPWGWIQVDLPKEQESVLFMGQVAIKSDWLDQEQGVIMDNSELVKAYDRVIRQMKRKLATPVMAENMVTGGKAAYRNVYYLPSARVFSDAGGRLMQEGVKNIKFTLPEPSKE